MNKTVWRQLDFPVGSKMGNEHWMHHSSKVCRHLHSWWGTKGLSSDPKLLSERVHFLWWAYINFTAVEPNRTRGGREKVNQVWAVFSSIRCRDTHKPWRWRYGGPWCRHSCPPAWTAPLLPTHQETHWFRWSESSHLQTDRLSRENLSFDVVSIIMRKQSMFPITHMFLFHNINLQVLHLIYQKEPQV